MSIVRRAPTVYLDGADLTLAKLIVKYAKSNPGASFSAKAGDTHSLGLLFTEDELFAAFRLMAIATGINRLEDMGRWLGKGGHLVSLEDGGLRVEMPDDVRKAVEAYERRRPKSSLFNSGGFFTTQPEPKDWTGYRIPILMSFGQGRYFEAPRGSSRWLFFERWPTMLDGGGLARLLRGYDEAIKEYWGVGADHIIHFLTALATLIHHSSPKIAALENEGAFEIEPPIPFEQKIGFAFGLARKGFLRFPRKSLVKDIGRVRTVLAQDSETGERLGEEFIDAFAFQADRADLVDTAVAAGTPFLHSSTDDYIYIDILLLLDFLASVLEGGKQWYASQHGDRFVLDLKRWLDLEAPGSVIDARLPVRLENGSMSDVDLLVRQPGGLLVVECKAYSKSHDFMIGAPDAVMKRRGLIREAVGQAERIATAYSRLLGEQRSAPPEEKRITAVVCTPSVEFLRPLEEHGMMSEKIPRVMTPEELLEIVTER